MQLYLTDEEAAALINLLTGAIEGDRFPTSPRLETLRQIRARLPGIREEPPSAAQPQDLDGVRDWRHHGGL